MFTRRQVIKTGVSCTVAGVMANMGLLDSIFAAGIGDSPPNKNGSNRSLIVIQLKGGNDGLNTVVPYGDGRYYDARPELAIPEERVLPLTNKFGLHPSLSEIKSLWDQGHVAIIQGVGYPNQSFSHFQSQHIWKTADPFSRKSDGGDGWLGRQLANLPSKDFNWFKGISLGKTYPISPMATEELALPAIKNLRSYQLAGQSSDFKTSNFNLNILQSLYQQSDDFDPYTHHLSATLQGALSTSATLNDSYNNYSPLANYPAGNFGQELKLLASTITENLGVRVAHLTIKGFDTHADEPTRHSELLKELSEGISAFYQDLQRHELDREVIIMTWSEFGRRVAMNGSYGTDHGSAAPLFIIGTSIQGGLYGDHPNLGNLEKGNLTFTTDFRSVYRTVLEDWLGHSDDIISHQPKFERIPIFVTEK